MSDIQNGNDAAADTKTLLTKELTMQRAKGRAG